MPENHNEKTPSDVEISGNGKENNEDLDIKKSDQSSVSAKHVSDNSDRSDVSEAQGNEEKEDQQEGIGEEE